MQYRIFNAVGGWRYAVLFHRGRKWIKLIDLGTLEIYKLPVSEQRKLVPYKSRSTKRLLREKAKTFKRNGLKFSKNAVTQAMEALS